MPPGAATRPPPAAWYEPPMDVSAHDWWMQCVHRQEVVILVCSPMRVDGEHPPEPNATQRHPNPPPTSTRPPPDPHPHQPTLTRRQDVHPHPVTVASGIHHPWTWAHDRWMACVHRQAVAILVCSPMRVDGEHPKAPKTSARHPEAPAGCHPKPTKPNPI